MEQNSGTSSPYSELTLRLFSAFFLVGITLAGTYLGGWYFSGLILLMSLLMSWEWFALTGSKRRGVAFVVQCLSLIGSVYCVTEGLILYSIALLVISMTIVLFLIYSKISVSEAPLWTAAGSLYTGLPAVAMIWFRQDTEMGFVVVLYLFFLAWTSDSAAYFGGKTIGGAKLWPSVSPNKTWAGFISGLLGCLALGIIFVLIDSRIDLASILIASLLLGLAVQAGDLVESAIKRHFGLKDTSSLIPGHGGVLDRVDGLVFAIILAAVFALILDRDNPGTSFLMSSTGSLKINTMLSPALYLC